MSQVEDLRNGLREVVRDLREARDRLLALHRSIPELSGEEEDEEPDPLSEMRAVIECGLQDCLEPLIRDLADSGGASPRLPGEDRRAGLPCF